MKHFLARNFFVATLVLACAFATVLPFANAMFRVPVLMHFMYPESAQAEQVGSVNQDQLNNAVGPLPGQAQPSETNGIVLEFSRMTAVGIHCDDIAILASGTMKTRDSGTSERDAIYEADQYAVLNAFTNSQVVALENMTHLIYMSQGVRRQDVFDSILYNCKHTQFETEK